MCSPTYKYGRVLERFFVVVESSFLLLVGSFGSHKIQMFIDNQYIAGCTAVPKIYNAHQKMKSKQH